MSKLNIPQEFLELTEVPIFKEYTFWELLQDRKILINEEITDDLIEKTIMQIIMFNEKDKDIPPEKRKPIEIYLNTSGGNVDVGLVLCNVIQNSKTPVHITVIARAYSMGGLILLAGHKRRAYEFSSILIHDGSTAIGGSTKKVKDTMKFYDTMEEKIKNYILKNSKISEELYLEKYGVEWFIWANEALELGIIDEIIR